MKFLISIIFGVVAASSIFSQTEQSARVTEIQTALRNAGLQGWLFYDFRGSDIVGQRILKLERAGGSRRWYYYIPAAGEPTFSCPKCEGNLKETDFGDIKIDVCDKCSGVWLDPGEMAQIMEKDKNGGWFGGLFK